MYKPVDTSLNFVEREKEVLAFWKENEIFEKSVEKNKGSKVSIFMTVLPPPTAKPHIGHILTRVMKDIIPRYKTMKGFYVRRKAGWDTHGLPVELEVEKLLGIDGKQEIEKYGIEPFIKKCKESVWKYKHEWEVMSDRIGYWADMKDPYITYDDRVYRVGVVGAETDGGQGSALQGLQDRALLPPLRHGALLPRSGAGL